MIRTIDLSTGAETSRDYTQEELEAAANAPKPNPKDAIRTQIDSLERLYMMPRATREFMLAYMEINAPSEVLEVNPGYQAVKDFDLQIKSLRDQL